MPTYKVRDPQTGRTVTLRGDSPPTEADLDQVFASLKPEAAQSQPGNTGVGGFVTGALKGAGKTISDLGDLARKIPGVAQLDRVMTPIPIDVTPRSTAEKVGYGAETAAEWAPVGIGAGKALIGGAKAAPGVIAKMAGASTARAAETLNAVTDAAKAAGTVVNAEKAGQAALAAQDLTATGSTVPKVVNKFLSRVTNPELGDLSFDEARAFYSNLTRQSPAEFNRLTPAMRMQTRAIRAELDAAIKESAETIGRGKDYTAAMQEYARSIKWAKRAASLKKLATGEAVKTAAASGAGAGAAAMLYKALLEGDR